ncbi:hypothetical protein FPSE5266_06781 [Fusarium pseudograminearum]|nr:hypothetical protein FPSE5266_06781 [Fusarium pseudograminearum]
MDDLLASFGRKAMGLKDELHYGQTISKTTLEIQRSMDNEEFERRAQSRLDEKKKEESSRQKRKVYRYRVTDTHHSPVGYLSDSVDEDVIVSTGKPGYAPPRTVPRLQYGDKASAAMRYIQSSKKEHKERKTTPQYALDKQNGVPLDIPDEDSEGYDSDLSNDEYEDFDERHYF